jgi:hypothetical protein
MRSTNTSHKCATGRNDCDYDMSIQDSAREQFHCELKLDRKEGRTHFVIFLRVDLLLRIELKTTQV